MNSSQSTEFTDALKSLAADYGVTLDQRSVDGLCAYYEILNFWNARLHLVAPTSPAEFATRHVLESLTVLPYLDDNAGVADVGSGGGLPIVPILIMRQDITATLIESSRKKAVFLREALKETKVTGRGAVINERFENVPPPDVDCVTGGSIERFEQWIQKLGELSPAAGRLLLFGGERLREPLESAGIVVES